MKVKIDVTEVKVEELTAELSKKTKESQLLKVMQTDSPLQRKNNAHSIV